MERSRFGIVWWGEERAHPFCFRNGQGSTPITSILFPVPAGYEDRGTHRADRPQGLLPQRS